MHKTIYLSSDKSTFVLNERFRYTHELDIFKNALHIREFYPEKNGHESKVKRDYGNKAYQEGKDLDALYLYTQVLF
jgi:hypothetical protein